MPDDRAARAVGEPGAGVIASLGQANLLDAVRNEPGQRVKVAVSDIDGVLRGKYLHRDKFFGAAEGGFGFCDVVFGWDIADALYDNVQYTGWHTAYPDAEAHQPPNAEQKKGPIPLGRSVEAELATITR